MFAYIGCFTTQKRKARGKGISVYRIDPTTGAWTLVQVLDTIANPGFLALDVQRGLLYAAHGDGAQTSAYSIDKQTGRLTFLNQQANAGDNSPHLVIDPTNRYLVLGNGPGIAVFLIEKDGALAPYSDCIVPPGEPGPYRHEQGHGAHPHQVLFDTTGRFLLAPDKGVDRVHIYRLDVSNGKLVANDPPCVKSRYGAGPRHMAFHPAKPYAYLINELDSTVTTYAWNSQRGELLSSR